MNCVIDPQRTYTRVMVVVLCRCVYLSAKQCSLVHNQQLARDGMDLIISKFLVRGIQRCSKDMVFSSITSVIHLAVVSNSIRETP